MPRPSRKIDELLLRHGRELLAESGPRALSIRKLTHHAGVNLGMFHYHFKSRDNFIRMVLQQVYDEMFASFSFEAQRGQSAREALRNAVGVLARWGRDNRMLLFRLINDALAGDPLAGEFLRANLPRHVMVIVGLMQAAQQSGTLRPVPVTQAVGFLAGAVAAPILVGTAAAASGMATQPFAVQFAHEVLSDEAIELRIEMALIGLSPAAESRPFKEPS
jgi:AcrR family transcriptional regulator